MLALQKLWSSVEAMLRLSEAIEALRKKEDLTNRELAKIMGVPYVTLFRFLKGRSINDRQMAKIVTWAFAYKPNASNP